MLNFWGENWFQLQDKLTCAFDINTTSLKIPIKEVESMIANYPDSMFIIRTSRNVKIKGIDWVETKPVPKPWDVLDKACSMRDFQNRFDYLKEHASAFKAIVTIHIRRNGLNQNTRLIGRLIYKIKSDYLLGLFAAELE